MSPLKSLNVISFGILLAVLWLVLREPAAAAAPSVVQGGCC